MNISEAFKLFGYSQISELDEKDIKRRYRKLIKLSHPDSGNRTDFSIDDVRHAKGILDRVSKLRNFSYSNNEIVFINVDTLINIYKNGKAKYNDLVISRDDLKYKNIYLDISYKVKVDGIEIDTNSLYVKYDYKDNYNIDLDVEMSNNSSSIDLDIAGIDKKVNLKGNCIELNFNFDYNINLKCRLYKKSRAEE